MVTREHYFQDNKTEHTSRPCKGYLNKKDSDSILHQMSRLSSASHSCFEMSVKATKMGKPQLKSS